MADNRNYINESSLVKREQILAKGLPILGLSGKYQVKEGYCAVLTEGGVYKETLGPGFYHLHKYRIFRELTATVVDMRTKTLEIETDQKHQIKYPFPVEVDLYLTIEYKVTDPRTIALEFEEPLRALFDRVTSVFDPIIANSSHEEVLTQRPLLSQKIYQGIQALQLPRTLGIDVRNVIITKLKVHDTGGDVISTRAKDETIYMREAQMEAYILAHAPRDFVSLLMQADPNERIKLMQTWIAEIGPLPESQMASPVWGGGSGFGQMQGMFGSHGGQAMLGGGYGQQQAFPNSPMTSSSWQGSPTPMLPGQGGGQNRMVDELNYLRAIPGAKVETRSETDQNGLATGGHMVKVTVPKQSGGRIDCYFHCPVQFPTVPPMFSLEVDGQDYPFTPASLRNWRSQYLSEIVREVINEVG